MPEITVGQTSMVSYSRWIYDRYMKSKMWQSAGFLQEVIMLCKQSLPYVKPVTGDANKRYISNMNVSSEVLGITLWVSTEEQLSLVKSGFFLVSMGRMGVYSTINRINSDVVIGNG